MKALNGRFAALGLILASACGGKLSDAGSGHLVTSNLPTIVPATPSPVPGTPSPSTDGRWLAFDSKREGSTRGIYLVRSDGVGLLRLSTSSAAEFEPAFSPDGQKLAYVSSETGRLQINIFDFATRAKVQLTHRPAGAHEPAWSPDGAYIAFTGLPEGLGLELGLEWYSPDSGFEVHQPPRVADLFVIGVDGSGERAIIGADTEGSTANYPHYYPANPTFGSDRDSIIYAGNSYIHIVGFDGTGHRKIGGVPSSGTETPSISPDGSLIAFATWGVDGQAIRVVEDTGIPVDQPPYDLSNLVVGPASARMNRRPAWGSTGIIVYETGPFPGPANLAIVAASGGEARPLTAGTFDDRNPTWAPVGFDPQSYHLP